jgi:hypothetical protein
MTTELRDRGIDSSMAVWPLVALDPPDQPTWQTILGTPVDGVDAGHVSVMMYTSLFEGWSRGILRRRDVTALLAAATARAARRWGRRTGVSLGCVGTGAFENEPTYRAPDELAEDAAIVRSAGIDQLSLFDLAGVLARAPAEAWFEALLGITRRRSSGTPIPSRRVRAVRALAHTSTWAARRLYLR